MEKRLGLDFSSNDYLALSDSQPLKQAAIDALQSGIGVGAGGSRLLRGNDTAHEKLEDIAADFFGAEKTLFVGGGFNANMAIFSTLPQKGDLIVYDELIHASAHEGMRLSKAHCVAFKHNDAKAADNTIAAWLGEDETRKTNAKIWVAFESVYSMDGDIADMSSFVTLADKYNGFAIIDEAHATGVFGEQGRGLAYAFHTQKNIITLHTCGKALGVSGALIGAPSVLIDLLVNKARGFIYATAPSPLNAAIVEASIDLLKTQPDLQKNLHQLVEHAMQQCAQIAGQKPSGTTIQPIIIGDDKRTMEIAKNMRERGFDVRGIRPPTVPRGTSRLRITITLHNTKEQISQMFDALKEELAK
ncbi:MAG: 8-amino-7-oxononanoate synthase [Nitratireductor sp.]